MSPRPLQIGTTAAPSRKGCDAGGASTLLQAQGEAKRGLRAGPVALGAARGASLGAQWSGEHDRRPETGLLVRTTL